MILYFSGTGNSRYAAEYIGAVTGEEPVSINDYLKNGVYPVLESNTPYVIAAPVYAWRLPHVVEDFLRKTEFQGNREIYFVLTCGAGIGNAGAWAKKLCEEKGLTYRGMADVLMPENYITMFRAPAPDREVLIMEKARGRLKSVASSIAGGSRLTQKSFRLRLFSSLINWGFYRFSVHDRLYYTRENCNGCGRCAKLCPLNNIKITDGRPVWKGNCTQCMACICGCPQEAVEFGRRAKGKRRYWCKPFDKQDVKR